MTFIAKFNKKDFWLIQKVKVGSKWKFKYIRKASQEEITAFNEAKQQKRDLALITCSNPECDKQIWIPRNQKRLFLTVYPLRYKRFELIYCSQACQEIHTKALKINLTK